MLPGAGLATSGGPMRYRPPDGKVRVTYLEMLAPPRDAAPAAPAGVTLSRVAPAELGDLATYRALYRRVGDPWQWVARRMLDDAELRAVFAQPRYELWHAVAGGRADRVRRARPSRSRPTSRSATSV